MAEQKRRAGVVLFQLGGPDTLEAIQPFLYNLFSDPDIIDFPFARLGRKPLAKLISTTRARKVQHHYSVIGGGSPIRKFTEQQARALESELARRGVNAACVVAMRYWHPFTAEAIEHLRGAGVGEIVLLPMYPQYSSTTTGSSLNEWQRRWDGGARVHRVREFYAHPRFLDAWVEKIEDALARFERPEEVELAFSAHSVPLSVIQRGDPYQQQVEDTVRLVTARGGWRNRHRLCYQSKVGASKWLQPSLRATVRQLATEKARAVCVVPISFVSDHVETLGEIDHEARELARHLGIERFEMTAGLNDSPTFITALSDLVMEKLGSGKRRVEEEELIAAD